MCISASTSLASNQQYAPRISQLSQQAAKNLGQEPETFGHPIQELPLAEGSDIAMTIDQCNGVDCAGNSKQELFVIV